MTKSTETASSQAAEAQSELASVVPARRLGRPRQSVLNRELIMQTALRLLDERGEQGAGIRELARELGVRPSALYNHISGSDDVIGGVRELISDRIDVSSFNVRPWEEALEQWALSYRAAFAAHPPTIALLAVRPLEAGSRTSGMYNAVCDGLLRAGWPEECVLDVVVACESYVLGAALDEAAPDDMLDPGNLDTVSAFRRAYDARSTVLGGAATGAAERAFSLGLRALLAGLRAEFEARTAE